MPGDLFFRPIHFIQQPFSKITARILLSNNQSQSFGGFVSPVAEMEMGANQPFGFENHLKHLPDLLRNYFSMFRCRNHRLPIEAGVRSQVLRDMRVYAHFVKHIGDEFHYLPCCVNFKEERKK